MSEYPLLEILDCERKLLFGTVYRANKNIRIKQSRFSYPDIILTGAWLI